MDKSKLRDKYIEKRLSMTRMEVDKLSKDVARNCLPLLEGYTEILMYEQIQPFNEINPAYISNQLNRSFDIAPTKKGSVFPTKIYDVIIIPCIAADTTGHRIGYGGGWYDRFLHQQTNAIKIVLCYESCLLKAIPHESHDIQADYVVTEKRAIPCTVE